VVNCLSHTSNPFSYDYFGDGGLMNYLPRLSSTMILPILASQVARVTDSHRCPAASWPLSGTTPSASLPHSFPMVNTPPQKVCPRHRPACVTLLTPLKDPGIPASELSLQSFLVSSDKTLFFEMLGIELGFHVLLSSTLYPTGHLTSFYYFFFLRQGLTLESRLASS
jgi:hypothetical protein